MVFSFFKKDPKDSRPGGGSGSREAGGAPRQSVKGRPLSGPVNRSMNRTTGSNTGGGFAVTENAVPDRETARTAAMATAAKIDAIEAEMARDFLRPRKPGGEAPLDPNREVIALEAAPPPPEPEAPPPAPPPPAPVAAKAPAAGKAPAAKAEEDDGFDPGTDVLAGSINAIEVNGDNTSVLDETAILFANRQDQAAESGLRAAIVAESLGAATERGWLMLLELMQQRNDRPSFEQFSTQFTLRFGVPAPSWISYADSAEVRPVQQRNGMPVVSLPATIDANIVKPLEEFKSLASTHPALGLDLTATREVDLVGAELLLRVFNAFKRASHELTLRGAEPLLVALRSAVEPGRRDPTDAAWMLLLEVQRLLNRQADFEETGIQYCITYEVSPPSWEPPLSNIRVDGSAAEKPAAPPAGAADNDPLNWKGEILGDGEQAIGHLLNAARTSPQVIIECRLLRRMAFSAATAMLGQLFKLQQTGIQVEFRNVNCLVAALWQLLGVSAVSEVRVRRA